MIIMIFEERDITTLIFKISIGEDINKSFQVFTDDACTVGFNYTYHTGTIKMKEDRRHSEVVLEFSTGNGRLSINFDGNVILTASRLDNISKLKANGARTYQADFMVLDTANNLRSKHANIIFEILETASL